MRTYTAYGSQHVYPISKSWRGDPQAPVAGTSRPVLVDDDEHTTEEQLRVHEAEALMRNGTRVHSWPWGYTSTTTSLHRKWLGPQRCDYVSPAFQDVAYQDS